MTRIGSTHVEIEMQSTGFLQTLIFDKLHFIKIVLSTVKTSEIVLIFTNINIGKT